MDRLRKNVQRHKTPPNPAPPPCPLQHENGKHYAGGAAGWVPCPTGSR